MGGKPDEEGCSSETLRDRRSRRRYTLLLAAWATVYLLSSFLITNVTLDPVSVAWIVALLPSIVATFAVFAYWRYLREADELSRAIEVKALALAVTVGFVVWPAIELLEAGRVNAFETT